MKKALPPLVQRLRSKAARALVGPPPSKHADDVVGRLWSWKTDDVVFDVGANDGRTIFRIGERLNNPRFYAFEPVSGTYQTLVDRTKAMSNVRCFQLALGAEPGRQAIHLHDESVMNSFVSAQGGAAGRAEEVEISTVDRMMSQLGIDFVHFLKIDTEGFEFEVIKGAAGALRDSRIGLIQAEIGFGQVQHEHGSFEEIRRFLAEYGYRLHGFYNQCTKQSLVPAGWPGELGSRFAPQVMEYCDALFVRADLEPEQQEADAARQSSLLEPA